MTAALAAVLVQTVVALGPGVDAALGDAARAELARSEPLLGWPSREVERVRILSTAPGAAHASRASLSAVLALPRAELGRRHPSLPPGFLPDGVLTSLVHEAAHLRAFDSLDGEERIPPSLHEGWAELAAERAEKRRLGLADAEIAPSFLRESVPELLEAARRGELPQLADLLAVAPRAAPSPQLWTAAAWWCARTLEESEPGSFAACMRAVAAGEEPAAALASRCGGRDRIDDLCLVRLRDARPTWWARGREVSAVERDGFLLAAEPGATCFLLAPEPGATAWLLAWEPRDARAFEATLDLEPITDAAEISLAFGLDADMNGARVVVPRSRRVAVERLAQGVPQFAREVELPVKDLSRIRVSRRDRRVRVSIGAQRADLPMPRECEASFGRVGVGVRGGVVLLRSFSVGGENPR
ncbi:MAG TPA: hypothetical protein VKE69_10495 [Planctomycetota bacterium]|nr:hypothetical protein [Planctomycetota bacterium]